MANNLNFGRAWYKPGPITLGVTTRLNPVGAYIDKTTGQLYMWTDRFRQSDTIRDIFNLPELDENSNAFIQPVEGFDGVKMISLEELGVILKNDGEAYIWSYTKRDPGGTASREAPQRVAGDDYIYASSAPDHAALIKEDGTVWCLGLNKRGAFGTGETSETFTSTPVQMLDITDAVKVVAFSDLLGMSPDSGTLVLKKDGSVWLAGASGTLTLESPNHTVSQIPSLSTIVDIAVGNGHAVALDERGDIYTWGRKALLGNGFDKVDEYQYTPAQVSFPIGVPPFVAIKSSPTSRNTFALAEDGTLWGWGIIRSIAAIPHMGISAGDNVRRPLAVTHRVADVCTTANKLSYIIRDNSFPDGHRLYYACGNGSRDVSLNPLVGRHHDGNQIVSNGNASTATWAESLPGAEGIDFPMDFSGLTGAPSSGSGSGLSKADVTLKATAVWFDTGVDVKRGGNLTITASGTWQNAQGGFAVGPNGFGDFFVDDSELNTANFASLIGRIGADGTPFFVGASFSENRSDTGRLFLQMNDTVGGQWDNAGQLEVSIEAG